MINGHRRFRPFPSSLRGSSRVPIAFFHASDACPELSTLSRSIYLNPSKQFVSEIWLNPETIRIIKKKVSSNFPPLDLSCQLKYLNSSSLLFEILKFFFIFTYTYVKRELAAYASLKGKPTRSLYKYENLRTLILIYLSFTFVHRQCTFNERNENSKLAFERVFEKPVSPPAMDFHSSSHSFTFDDL